jgi:DNA-binding MurR/RpiR family transcriptional regulator
MPGILSALQEGRPTMNRKEKELASYILHHSQNIAQMGIKQLAQESGSSTATISRFCKQFRFSGFTEFKVKLAAELAQLPSAAAYQDIIAGNPLSRIVEAMEANHVRSITDTTRMLDIKQLQKAINALQNARQIDLYGVATSGLVAQDLYQKLVRIGKHATAFSDPHMQLTSAANLTADDAVIGISYSGETTETVAALKCGKEQGAVTIAITKFGSSKLTALADICLFTSTLEEGMRRGDMASRIAQLHVVDLLFVGMLSEQFDEYVPRLEQSFQMVKKYR